MRPILPKEITNKLPIEIIQHIYSYVPHNEKEKEINMSHSFQKDLKAIQSPKLKGKSSMYMRGMEEEMV
jgi:hypothetical protein